MPTVQLIAPPLELTLDAREGGPLVDLCDKHRLPVAFSCRDANCGSCRVVVLEGADELDPAGSEERATLATLAATSAERLACRAVMRAGDAVLRLRPRPTSG